MLSSVNLTKILGLLESKERKINALQDSEANLNDYIGTMARLSETEVKRVKMRANDEAKYKV